MKPVNIQVGKTYSSGLNGVYRRTVVARDRTYRDGELVHDKVKFIPIRETNHSNYITGRTYSISREEFTKWAKMEIAM